ncbi:hypothetical protein B0H63DRAFT_467381 [Podospora didyma]|uniref:Uncharacterized protein n=1 Tax=Podospora didyma TaxID=330526 RepID=A0AAE0P0I6_9PEZI|nr:hypothetical protein B0H63DRAFT_467381 [Podospora didyma]
MALDPGTILSVVDLVQRALAIYNRIDGLPQQMVQLGKRMQSLNVFLLSFEAFVNQKQSAAFATLYPGQKDEMGRLLESIKGHAAKAHDLFDRYEKGIVSRTHDVTFRFGWAAQMWFSLVENSPEKVQAVMDDIEVDRRWLCDWLTFLNAAILVNGVNQESRPKKPAPIAGPAKDSKKGDKAKGGSSASPGKKNNSPTSLKQPNPAARRPSLSPSPAPPKRDYKILFVDPNNEGRSVAAEAFTKLLGELTRRANGDWRIAFAHSAGFFVKARGDCTDVIEGLDYSYKSFKLPFKDGGASPTKAALAALFDNTAYDYPFKKPIRDEITARKSRGLRRDMFAMYDYILVFTSREHDNIIKLKQALLQKYPDLEIPRGKGRVLHLGTFVAREANGRPREIIVPKKSPGWMETREMWNLQMGVIKTAVKKFLEQELKWKRPDNVAVASGSVLAVAKSPIL